MNRPQAVKRPPLRSVLVIGSGPIVIGQACEFDYSGVQALKSLRKNGVRTILLNPNPATIMTDPALADRTYIEPLTVDVLDRILAAEKPDAVLPTMGGQTALNLAMDAQKRGILKRRGALLIGADHRAIRYAEDRLAFRKRMAAFGLPLPEGRSARNLRELTAAARHLRFPLMMRASYTLGGLGSSVIGDAEQLREAYAQAVAFSGNSLVLLEEFLEGWQEFELEVMRDVADNCVVVCSMENIDPMGVHTGDSATVAPIQTLTDAEYQAMRAMAFTCIRAVGVETGGANVQFAREPATGRLLLIEMNPRVSRSSALASKATGFPIAAIAAELALGKTLDEIQNDVTGRTTAAFEPSLDYAVVKLPQFQFSKFDAKTPWLGTSMKSVGEAMAIGRVFPEALQKAARSLEEGHLGLHLPLLAAKSADEVRRRVATPNPERLFYVKEALDRGIPAREVSALSRIHPWFIHQIARLVDCERRLSRGASPAALREAKGLGFSDARISQLGGRPRRLEPAYCEVDTCAGEFEASTPYYYSTFNEAPRPPRPRGRKKRYVLLGAGPNKIGEGLEFDYSCVHAAQAIREAGGEVVLVNSNPETVSTDYDVSDRLYFDPVGLEEVEHILRRERPDGVVLQFGGQTPLNLAQALDQGGWPILGTPVRYIIQSEERTDFAQTLRRLKIPYPRFRAAHHKKDVAKAAEAVGFPILLRPSFVMGGDRIRIFKDAANLKGFLDAYPGKDGRFLVDRFLSPASEVDVDAVSDGHDVRLCGILEHIEPAGIHSGDSSMLHPTVNLSEGCLREIREHTRRLARAFKIKGLCNLQFAIYQERPYVIELNARASRTVPFLSKATGVPWAKVATRILLGQTLKAALARYPRRAAGGLFYAKSSAFCFYRFAGPPPPLGPEMRSTGETMGIAATAEEALAKARLAAGQEPPLGPFSKIYCLQDL